ncbi:hypothetical protein [Pyrobaculum aerophilum]|uniref:hypothetical protein n=1 Tax=Pyrobaculum aerophilum TaxID=13773 RepID=UPI0011C061B9|nr:hypothetical protein [Pyrobaculum aerophilum]
MVRRLEEYYVLCEMAKAAEKGSAREVVAFRVTNCKKGAFARGLCAIQEAWRILGAASVRCLLRP